MVTFTSPASAHTRPNPSDGARRTTALVATNCAHRNGCLGVAYRAGWREMDCSACNAYERQSPEQDRQDAEGLAALISAARFSGRR